MGAPFTNRILKRQTKTIVIDGTVLGPIGSIPVLTITGCVWIECLVVRCLTSLTGASATIALGTAGNTGGLIAATTATGITAGLIWNGTTPATGVGAAIVNYAADLNIIATVATAGITGGSFEVEVYWLPLSANGNLN